MSKRKLLLADESATIQKVVNLSFADEGIEVTVAASGDSALEKIAENLPDLILADVNMPGLSGYEICELIKQDEKTKHIPVILLVGSFESFDEEKARSVGADDYMTKPFKSIRQLVTKVSGLLNADAADLDGAAKKPTADDFAAQTSAVAPSEDVSQTVSATADADASTGEQIVQTNQIDDSAVGEPEDSSSAPSDENSSETLSGGANDADDEIRIVSANAAESIEPDSSRADDADATLLNDAKIEDFADADSARETTSSDSAIDEADSLSEKSFAAAQSYGRISEPDATDDSVTDAYDESAGDLPVNPPVNPFAGIELDEANLLELSFDDDDEFDEFEDEAIEESGLGQFVEAAESASPEPPDAKVSFTARQFHAESPVAMPAEEEIYAAIITESPAENRASFENISPALIEAIAARVVEKLSDRVIREIAAVVVPQMADSIIKQMARDEFSN